MEDAGVSVMLAERDARSPADLLVESLEYVGALGVLVVGLRNTVEGPGLLDVILGAAGERGVGGLP